VKSRPRARTVFVLFGITVLTYLVALGTFDFYFAILADLLLLATVTTGLVATISAIRHRHLH
jgi:hypothetical protein